MIPFENPSASIVDAFVNNSPNAKNRLLSRFGSGLLFLIERQCWEQAEQFYADVVNATIDAVLRREISTDKELPKLIRSIFRRLLPYYEEDLASHRALVLDGIGGNYSKAINVVRQGLSMFGPLQGEALSRFYVNGEAITVICSDLGISQEQFRDTRKVAWQLVRLALYDLEPSQKRPSGVRKMMAFRQERLQAKHPVAVVARRQLVWLAVGSDQVRCSADSATVLSPSTRQERGVPLPLNLT